MTLRAYALCFFLISNWRDSVATGVSMGLKAVFGFRCPIAVYTYK